jgi:hypothetical protein
MNAMTESPGSAMGNPFDGRTKRWRQLLQHVLRDAVPGHYDVRESAQANDTRIAPCAI